jgi:uncharacterized damage-inducible protein DinB
MLPPINFQQAPVKRRIPTNYMKKLICAAVLCLLAPSARAQVKAGDPNPVTASAREVLDRSSKNIIAAAQEMPAYKYSFRPTAGQESFGKIVEHLAESNNEVCALISDTRAPHPKLDETDSKEVLVAAMKASFTFCASSLMKLQDSKMGDAITFIGGRKVPRARAVFELTDDINDHYAQLASYLRAADLPPPTAKQESQGQVKQKP